MRIVINNVAVALGDPLPEEARAGAGLYRPGLWRRLLRRDRSAGERLEAANCVIEAFDGRFRLYPCTHDYLTADRQWRTAASVRLERGRVRSVLLQVIEGRYAAGEFTDRFLEACRAELGDGHALDRYTRRWRNGTAACLSALQPDGRNASFLFELLDA